jgi:hypothetical protein
MVSCLIYRHNRIKVNSTFQTAMPWTHARGPFRGRHSIAVEVANRRNVSVTVLTPMDETVKKLSRYFEKQSTNIQIRNIEPSSRSPITVLIVDR